MVSGLRPCRPDRFVSHCAFVPSSTSEGMVAWLPLLMLALVEILLLGFVQAMVTTTV